jgi:hypothetical protein
MLHVLCIYAILCVIPNVSSSATVPIKVKMLRFGNELINEHVIAPGKSDPPQSHPQLTTCMHMQVP